MARLPGDRALRALGAGRWAAGDGLRKDATKRLVRVLTHDARYGEPCCPVAPWTNSHGVTSGRALLKFRCTGCGNCCKDPLLPLTDADVARIIARTRERAIDIVRFVNRHQIDMDDDPDAFVRLRQGKRVMVLGHERGGCRYLDSENRCKVYGFRPLGCRVFPFDSSFSRTGALRRLRLIQATDCRYELDGKNYVANIREMKERHDAATSDYYAKIADWNRRQIARRRTGRAAQTAREFLEFLGLQAAHPAERAARPTPRQLTV